MPIVLKGSWPACLSTGILLRSKARSFGQPLQVSIVEAPQIEVLGPALLHDPLLVGLGLPASVEDPNMVVLPGKADADLLMLTDYEQWALIDRSGKGRTVEARSLVSLLRSVDPRARGLVSQVQLVFQRLGLMIEPGVLDLLFAHDIDLSSRLQLFLHLGRFLSNRSGDSLRVFLQQKQQNISFRPSIEHLFDEWVKHCSKLSQEHELLGNSIHLLRDSLYELPVSRLSTPLTRVSLGVVRAFCEGIAAISNEDNAISYMKKRFRFLGGHFVPSSANVIELTDEPVPGGQIAKWRWLCQQAQAGAAEVDQIWNQIMDPVQ